MVIRLQGTDGVRKTTRLSGEISGNTDPLHLFFNKEIITEEFVELYSYSFVECLKENNLLVGDNRIVVGWDPRDTEGIFTRMAIQGIRKAGATSVVIGIMPTPMVPIYIDYIKACGGLMLTASHNPFDQNGIKVFWGDMGLKPLPSDDIILSNCIFKQDYKAIKQKKVIGGYIDNVNEAWDLFYIFHSNPVNTWLTEDISLDNYVIFLDCANGSYSNRLNRLFEILGFKTVIEVNNSQDGKVNHRCGVAFLEGRYEIYSKALDNPEFSDNELIKGIFAFGRDKKKEILDSELWVCGVSFDADGDRFYRLDYDPIDDKIVIITGDEAILYQARYLKDIKGKNGRFVSTIESDINTLVVAKGLGLDTELTVVGDKWILTKAVINLLKRYISISLKYRDNDKILLELISRYERYEGNRLSVIYLLNGMRYIEQLALQYPGLYSEIEDFNRLGGGAEFFVGGEESGHSITCGQLYDKEGRCRLVFAGNGVKGAINTFVAIDRLLHVHATVADIREKITHIKHPFNKGIKRVFYIYYINKRFLRNTTPLFTELSALILDLCNKYPNNLKARQISFSEDLDLLYIGLFSENNVQVAGIFCRNSGTEDKASINIRGDIRYEKELYSICEEVWKYLITRLKDYKNSYADAEVRLLSELYNKNYLTTDKIAIPNNDVILDRLITEMEKQRLILVDKGGISIDEMGRWYIKERKENKQP